MFLHTKIMQIISICKFTIGKQCNKQHICTLSLSVPDLALFSVKFHVKMRLEGHLQGHLGGQ